MRERLRANQERLPSGSFTLVRHPPDGPAGRHESNLTMSVSESPVLVADDFRLAAVDLYRDIHKGIRAELFAVTTAAGALDPSDPLAWAAFGEHVRSVEAMLAQHAWHEDAFIDPVLAQHVPELAAQIAADHRDFDADFAAIVRAAAQGTAAPADDQRRLAHLVYLQLASFTSEYLAHQAVEETVATPLLEGAIGPEAVGGLLGAILGSIPPQEMATTMAIMLPAMNVYDRVEMLAGVRASAPEPAFAGVVSLARSVLTAADFDALAGHLQLAA